MYPQQPGCFEVRNVQPFGLCNSCREPYSGPCQEPCQILWWEPIGNLLRNLNGNWYLEFLGVALGTLWTWNLGNTIRKPCWERLETLSAIREPYRQAYREPVNSLSSKALYRNFVGNLKPIEPYIGTLSETLSGNFETPIRNLVGNLKPGTRNR